MGVGAEGEIRSAGVLGRSGEWSRGCWLVRMVWEAERTVHRLRAAGVALDGSWIGRGWRSVSRNCRTPCFGDQDVEGRVRLVLFGWRLMIWACWKMNAEGCVEGKWPRSAARPHLEAVRLATSAAGLLMLNLVRKLGGLELLSMMARFVAIQSWTILDRVRSTLRVVAESVLPWVVHDYIGRAYLVGLRCGSRAVPSDLDETAVEG